MRVGAAAWPAPVDAADPFVGVLDEVVPAHRALAEALRSTSDPAEIAHRAAAVGLDAPLAPDSETPAPVPAGSVPTDGDLVRIGTDHEPALVPEALELLLGRDPDRWPAGSRIAAVAWGALFPRSDGVTPLHRWTHRAPAHLRPAARALARTPPVFWRVVARAGEERGVTLREVCGWLGHAEVQVRWTGGPALIARLVATHTGWHLATPIEVPTIGDPARLDAWLRLAALAERARGRDVRTVADALRIAGHHVTRWVLAGSAT